MPSVDPAPVDDAARPPHTAASLAAQAGANVKAVERMLEHASASTTLDVYTDLFDADLDSVAVRVDEGFKLSNVARLWSSPITGISAG